MHTYKFLNGYTNKRTGEINMNVNNDEYKLLSPDFISINDQDEIKIKLNLTDYRTFEDPWNTDYNSVDNLILASYSKCQVTNMISNSNIEYDYIIYVRPDCKYLVDFDLNYLKYVNNNTICIPNFGLYGPYNFNDRFCICNFNNYKLYGDIFDKLLKLSKLMPLHSETIIGHIINEYKLNIYRIPFIFIRIRCNGKKVAEKNNSIIKRVLN